MKPIEKKHSPEKRSVSVARTKTAQTKNIALDTTNKRTQKVSGLDFPIWLRNKHGEITFGLKVDQITHTGNEIHVHGWQVGSLCKIHLKLNGKNLTTTLTRKSTLDVAQSLGIKGPIVGTGFQLSAAIHPSKISTFELVLNWSVDTQSGEVILCKEKPVELSPHIRHKRNIPEARHHFDKIDGPCLHGWVEVNGRPAKEIAIKANNRVIDCTALKKERKDVSLELGIEAIDLGFLIAIPGYLWEKIPFEEGVFIQLVADGSPLDNGGSVLLSRKHIAEWIERLIILPDDDEKQFLTLIALEHIFYGGLSKLLSSNTLDFVHEFADIMNLSEFVATDKAKSETLPLADSFSNFLLWKAQRTLNEHLHEVNSPNDVFSAMVDAMRDFGLVGDVKERYLCSVVSLLCRHNVFDRLHEITDFPYWYDYDDYNNVWWLTLALPFQIVDYKIERATNTAWKLSKYLENGWMNTECIHYCVREVGSQMRAGLISGEQAQEFGYAIMACLMLLKESGSPGSIISNSYGQRLRWSTYLMPTRINFAAISLKI